MNTRVRVQAARFARLFAVALTSQEAVLAGQHWARSAVVAAVVGAAETAWRQYKTPPDVAYTPEHQA